MALRIYVVMLVEEFISLDIDNRAEYVWAEGNRVTSISYYNQVVILYALPNFLVEVFFQPAENRIVDLEPLDRDHPRFKLYLDSIDVAELLNR